MLQFILLKTNNYNYKDYDNVSDMNIILKMNDIYFK